MSSYFISINKSHISLRLRTKSWREECSWTVDFADDDDNKQDITYDNFDDEEVAHISVLGGSGLGEGGTSDSSSKELRHFTAIHSSWTFFPESVNVPVTSPTAMGSVASGSSSTSTTTASTSITTDSIQEQRLKHQITTLENELNDSSSMRDRDDMYEELRLAKREMRSLKPWYKRLW